MDKTRVTAGCFTCMETYGPRILTAYADAKGYDCVESAHRAAGHNVQKVEVHVSPRYLAALRCCAGKVRA